MEGVAPTLLQSGADHLSADLVRDLITSTDSGIPVMYSNYQYDTRVGARAWRHEAQTGLNCPAHALNNLYQRHLLDGTGGADLFELQRMFPTLRIYSLKTQTVYGEPLDDLGVANYDMLLALLCARPGFLLMRGPHYVAVRRHLFTHTLPPIRRWCVLDSCCAGVMLFSAAGLLRRALSDASAAYAVPNVDGGLRAHALLDVTLSHINTNGL